MVVTLHHLRELIGRDIRPIRAALAHARNADLPEFARFFGCPAEFGRAVDQGAASDMLEFSNAAVPVPLLTADPTLLKALEPICDVVAKANPLFWCLANAKGLRPRRTGSSRGPDARVSSCAWWWWGGVRLRLELDQPQDHVAVALTPVRTFLPSLRTSNRASVQFTRGERGVTFVRRGESPRRVAPVPTSAHPINLDLRRGATSGHVGRSQTWRLKWGLAPEKKRPSFTFQLLLRLEFLRRLRQRRGVA